MVFCICCSRSAPKLLAYVSLLLAIISGAGVATLARLKWDPSTYLILRGILPTEYRVLSGVLCFGTFLLILLAHLALIAVNIRRGSYQNVRRSMFFTYAAMVTSLIIVELAVLGWLCVRVIKWLQTDEAKTVLDALVELEKLGSGVKKIIGTAGFFYDPLRELHEHINEILADIPYNVYVGILFVGLTAVLELAALILAWNSAFTYTKAGDTCRNSTKIVHTIQYNSYNGKKPFPADTNDEKEFKLRDNYLAAIK